MRKVNWNDLFKHCKDVNVMTDLFYSKMFEVIACCVSVKKNILMNTQDG